MNGEEEEIEDDGPM
jgi:DNA repair protein RAD51